FVYGICFKRAMPPDNLESILKASSGDPAVAALLSEYKKQYEALPHLGKNASHYHAKLGEFVYETRCYSDEFVISKEIKHLDKLANTYKDNENIKQAISAWTIHFKKLITLSEIVILSKQPIFKDKRQELKKNIISRSEPEFVPKDYS